jgi:hypothetical protein
MSERNGRPAGNGAANVSAGSGDTASVPTASLSRALPGVWLDLLTDGADIRRGGKSAAVRAVRQVMLAAHRAGWEYVDLQPLLTDAKGRKLAAQVATGRGGRKINPRQVDDFLRKHWDGTAKLADAKPTWTHDDVLGAIELVTAAVDAADNLGRRERAVMRAVLDLADQHGTTRVAAPVRVVAEAAGLTVPTAHRVLMDLCQRGEWLDIAKRGSRQAGRSNLYSLAPSLLETYKGATPPTSQYVPTSHLPTSHSERESGMAATVTFTLTPEQSAQVAVLVSQLKQAEAATTDRQPASVVDLATRRAAQ